MLSDLSLTILLLFVILSCMTLFYWVVGLHEEVPDDDREFKDPLPKLLALIWPVVRIIAYYLCAYIPYPFIESIEKKIQRNGVAYLMIAEELIALKIVAGFITLIIGSVALFLVGEWNNVFLLVFPLIGYFYS